jgi:hypothetical protein
MTGSASESNDNECVDPGDFVLGAYRRNDANIYRKSTMLWHLGR